MSKLLQSLASPTTITLLTLSLLACSGSDGTPGEDGADGTSCTATEQEDGTVTIQCGDDDPITLPAPVDGEDGQPGVDGQPGEDGQPGSPGEDGEDGRPGEDGVDGTEIVVRTEGASMVKCPAGGTTVYIGPDVDGDGELSEAEQTRIFVVCNGEDGLDSGESPPASLIRVEDAPIQSCPDGGKTVAIGVDTDRSGVLDNSEVTSAFDVCNGSDGMGGMGTSGAVVFKVSPGSATTCGDAGGSIFAVGIDDDKDGTLDVNEIDAMLDVCNGARGAQGQDGKSALIETSQEPPGTQCSSGGLKIEVGIDIDGSGTLDATEIDANKTSYLCDTTSDGYTQLSSFSSHTCGIKSSGDVYCWGNNAFGQLGTGDYQSHTTPQRVTGIPGRATQIQTGNNFTCALTDTDQVWCWGDNTNGVVSSSPTTNYTTPQYVADLTRSIDAGQAHACRVTQTNDRFCWGRNQYGQLGTTNNNTAKTHVKQVTAGYHHSCALLLNNQVWCWGRNNGGQLGNGTTTNSSSAVRVNIDEPIAKLAAGETHTCALLESKEVICWGDDSHGQLGDGTGNSSTTSPGAQVVNVTLAIDIATNRGTTCILSDAGSVSCWGDYFPAYSVRGSAGGNPTVPAAIMKPAGAATHVTVGSQTGCIALTDGRAQCWGDNTDGTIGDGTLQSARTPTFVFLTEDRYIDLGVSRDHACGLRDDGSVRCWGSNTSGQLGDGTTTDTRTPTPVSNLGSGVIQVDAGATHTCALFEDNTAKCWGDNQFGQLGDLSTTNRLTPVAVSNTGLMIKIEAGQSHTCALRSNGSVLCWGRNHLGQLGKGDNVDSNFATTVVGLGSDAADIAVGDNHTCAIAFGGKVYCWGFNFYGELGNGTGPSQNAPAQVVFPDPNIRALSISAGNNHTCATFEDASTYCWGKNAQGQLGLSMTSTSETTPVKIPNLSSSEVFTGHDQTCFRNYPNGTIVCAGDTPHTTSLASQTGMKALDIGGGDDFYCTLTPAGWIRCEGKGERLGVGAIGDTSFLLSILD